MSFAIEIIIGVVVGSLAYFIDAYYIYKVNKDYIEKIDKTFK